MDETGHVPMTHPSVLALARKVNLECDDLACDRCERIRWRIAECLYWVMKNPAAVLAALGREA